MDLPELPNPIENETFDHDLDYDEVRGIWNGLIAEIIDPEYQNRTHGNRRTYDAGCRGPMCGKGVREHNRKRHNTVNSKGKYCYIDPIVDYYRPIAERMVLEAFMRVEEELTA